MLNNVDIFHCYLFLVQRFMVLGLIARLSGFPVGLLAENICWALNSKTQSVKARLAFNLCCTLMCQQFGGIIDITLISDGLPTHFYEQTWSHSALARKVLSPNNGLANPWLCWYLLWSASGLCCHSCMAHSQPKTQAGRAEERAGEEKRKMEQS